MTATRKKFTQGLCAIIALMMIITSGLITAEAKTISKEKAKSIAIKDAGIKKSKAVFIETKLKTDDGVKQYDIEFVSGSKSYDYEIKANNGKILEKEVKKIKNPTKKFITKAKAKKIALKDSGFKKSEVNFKKCKLDIENRYVIYEVEFYKNSREYEYEINAKTGKIMSRD
jgi:uncharacterized membrane protein YkoI